MGTAKALMANAVLKVEGRGEKSVEKRDPDFELSNTDFLTH